MGRDPRTSRPGVSRRPGQTSSVQGAARKAPALVAAAPVLTVAVLAAVPGVPRSAVVAAALLAAGSTVSLVRWLLAPMERLALHDPLTGLWNRRAAEPRLVASVAQAGRDGRPLSVAMVDLDGFKRVNDADGHAAGDRALQAAAEVFGSNLRAGDWVARWGGEEFLVVCHTDGPGARDALDRVRRLLTARTSVTASVGAAELRPGESAAECLRRADGALYAGKTAGRDRVVLAGPGRTLIR
jgi:diguanylate cyclase (GGDEF)-like protein